MNQNRNIEVPDSRSKTIRDRSAAVAAPANAGTAKADSIKLTRGDEELSIEVKIETELQRKELVVLWLFIAVLVILTFVAGYLFWKKVSSTF
jgi:hypothetical protein